MTRELRQTVFAILLGSSVACGRSDGPLEPAWGKEPCAHCAMVVGDKRYAAEILSNDGTRRYFDDIGCMVVFVEEQGLHGKAWVRDETKNTWLDAESARYRRGARTPMDYGFAAGSAGPLTFDEVRREVLAKGRPSS